MHISSFRAFVVCTYEKAVHGNHARTTPTPTIKVSHSQRLGMSVCAPCACVQLHQIADIHSYTRWSFFNICLFWLFHSIAFKRYGRISQLKCHWLSINMCICAHISLLLLSCLCIHILFCLLFISTSNVCECAFVSIHSIATSTTVTIFLFSCLFYAVWMFAKNISHMFMCVHAWSENYMANMIIVRICTHMYRICVLCIHLNP